MTDSLERWVGGVLLVLASVGIWCRDTGWTVEMADTLPLALGLPVAFALGRPWTIKSSHEEKNFSPWLPVLGSAGFCIGWLTSSITLLAVSLAALGFAWTLRHFTSQPRRARLFLLVILSFPWLVLDWPAIGWNFRISAAMVAEWLFNLLQLPTVREGTRFVVMGLPIDVKPSCAGWNLLQLSLLCGVTLGIMELRETRRFLLLLAFLPFFAWIANLLRILALAAIGLSFDAQVATGSLHSLTGLAVLALVLVIIRGVCHLLSVNPPTSSLPSQSR